MGRGGGETRPTMSAFDMLFNGIYEQRHPAWSCYVGANRNQKQCSMLAKQEPAQNDAAFQGTATKDCQAQYKTHLGITTLVRPSLCVINPAANRGIAPTVNS